MALLNSTDWKCADAIAGIGYCNPFLPERVELERQALGARFVEGPSVRQRGPEPSMAEMFPNTLPMAEHGGELLAAMPEKLIAGASASEAELVTYEDLGLVTLYIHYMSSRGGLVFAELRDHRATEKIQFWQDFRSEFYHYFELPV